MQIFKKNILTLAISSLAVTSLTAHAGDLAIDQIINEEINIESKATDGGFYGRAAFETSTSSQNVINKGKITVTAVSDDISDAKGAGIVMHGSGNIENSGSIFVQTTAQLDPAGIDSPDTFGILVNSESTNHIVNTGTIDSYTAIYGNDKTTLEMGEGSTIIGRIKGVQTTTVSGNAIFDGAEIGNFEQPGSSLTVKSGAKLELLNTKDPGHDINAFVEQFTVEQGATLALTITPELRKNQVLDVWGNLTLENGSTIEVNAGKGLSVNGKDYILIDAAFGKIDDQGVEVEGTSLLKVNSWEIVKTPSDDPAHTGDALIVNVSVTSAEEIIEEVKLQGATGNAQAVAAHLNALTVAFSNSGNTALEEFAQTLTGMNNQQLSQVAEQMVAEVDGGAVHAISSGQSLITGVTSGRTTALRGQSSGVALSNAGVWVQGLYNDARQATRDNVAGYNAYTSGLAVGADAKVTDNLTLGAAYSYMDSSVNSKRGNKTEVDGHAFTVYGGFEQGSYFVDGNLTFSKNENTSKRNVLNTVAKGKYDSKALGLSLLGGYDFQLDHSLTATPLAGLRYTNIKIDSFTEKGSPAALRNGKQRYEMAELGLGGRLSANYQLGQGRLQPQIQAMVYHDLAADRVKTTSSFTNVVGGNSFVAYGAKPVRTSYEASIGTDYKLGAFTVGASYGYAGRKGFNSDTFAAKVRYDF